MNLKRLMIFGFMVGILAMVLAGCATTSQSARGTSYAEYCSDQYTKTGVNPAYQCGPGAKNARANEDWAVAEMTTPLPPDAKPGECYARVFVPPRYETVTENVLVREASERVETIPAKYEVVEEKVMVKGPSKRLEEVAAQYEWKDEQVLVEEAHNEWRAGRGVVERVDSATGEVMCLVEVPASYKTVRKQVLVQPATVREVEIPAEYQTIKVTKMTSPPEEKRIPVPAEYQTVTRTQKVSDGHMEWKRVVCETDQQSRAGK